MAGKVPQQPDRTAIPVRLSGRPVIGGLAIPWVTTQHADGTPVLGFIDPRRQTACLTDRLCQACGQQLGSPMVLMVRARDVLAGFVNEPALHPECAAYSAVACPMLAGMMARYRSAPRPARQERCGNPSCQCRAWVTSGDRDLRAGRPREAFAAVWIDRSQYQVTASPAGGAPPRLGLRDLRVLTVRPVTPGQPDGWMTLSSALPRGSVWPAEIILIAALDLAAQHRQMTEPDRADGPEEDMTIDPSAPNPGSDRGHRPRSQG
jgi:hypothetical protein